MSKFKVEFSGFEEMRKKLLALGANVDQVAEDALRVTNDIVVARLEKAIAKPNLPAGGKYSTAPKKGSVQSSLRRDPLIEKQNGQVSAYIGFDMKESGMKSIWLMKGTPKYSPVRGLKEAFQDQNGEIAAAQKRIFEDYIEAYAK